MFVADAVELSQGGEKVSKRMDHWILRVNGYVLMDFWCFAFGSLYAPLLCLHVHDMFSGLKEEGWGMKKVCVWVGGCVSVRVCARGSKHNDGKGRGGEGSMMDEIMQKREFVCAVLPTYIQIVHVLSYLGLLEKQIKK